MIYYVTNNNNNIVNYAMIEYNVDVSCSQSYIIL